MWNLLIRNLFELKTEKEVKYERANENATIALAF
jgi:hypothetical protein